jgi:hypothetical protein
MGVRDALRMVDSFLKWSERNRGRAKSLDEFVHDGLIAAAKRCESCLSEKLGVKFGAEGEDASDETHQDAFSSSEKSLSEAAVETLSESSLEQDSGEYEERITSPPEPPEEALTVDDVDRAEEESVSDYDVEGPPRDFTSDFELIEPAPLVVEAEQGDTDRIEEAPEVEPFLADESEAEEEEEEMHRSDIASFTWADYEEAVAPSTEPENTELEDEEESDDIPEPWTPYDEPSIPDEELSRELEEETTPEEQILEEEDQEEADSAVTHPPPPPPPESDEDEEERKRRARRLFFGA